MDAMNSEAPSHRQRMLCGEAPARVAGIGKKLPVGDSPAEESVKEPSPMLKRKCCSAEPEYFRKKAKTQSDEEIADCRKHIVQVLEKRLENLKASNVPCVKDMPAFARATERTLFATASSVEEHCSIENLDERLSALFTALIFRRYRKQDKEQNRGLFLQELLGEEKLNELLSAVEEIRALRLSVAPVKSCNSAACSSSTNAGAENHPPLPQKIPDQVKNIFFRNRLVQAVEHAPMDKLSTLDWDDLLLEAQYHIQEYRTWFSRQVQEGEATETPSETCE